MLTQLFIRDFALVEQLELEFSAGMTALTGETGAGKSILLDAIGLALGDRADANAIRQGADKADIALTFNLDDCQPAQRWLQDNDLHADNECILRRVIARDGRSRAYINGQPVPLQHLKDLGEYLLDIHGQHAHQSLVKRDTQRELLDRYAEHTALLETVHHHYQQLDTLTQELEKLRQAGADRAARQDLLRFQTQELRDLALGDEEYPQLLNELALLANGERILASCQQAITALSDDDDHAARRQLNRALQALGAISHLDNHIAEAIELVNSALIQVDEGTEQLRRYAEGIDLDPTRLDTLQERVATAQSLARKHRIMPEELPALLQNLETELNQLDHYDQAIDTLAKQHQQSVMAYQQAAQALSLSRQRAAERLAHLVTDYLRQVAMPTGQFSIDVTLHPESTPSQHGLDQISFAVTANPGIPPQPINKVASGGELSRISLAIQVAAADSTQIPSLIFDEVDSGIGGGVAEIIGKQLRALGTQRQVFGVTHLHQVAAQAHNHYKVAKTVIGNQTRTHVTPLGSEQRIEEIARMFGGVEITASTLAHARELLASATPSTPTNTTPRKGKRKAEA